MTEKNITLALKHLIIMAQEEVDAKAMEFLKRVGLEDKATAYPSTLSGRQTQRVAIVRALAMNLVAILFDKPTSALDPEMVGEVLQVMKDLAEGGMTMIAVAHEINFASEVVNRVLFMDEERILEEALSREFFSSPKHSRLQSFYQKCCKPAEVL